MGRVEGAGTAHERCVVELKGGMQRTLRRDNLVLLREKKPVTAEDLDYEAHKRDIESYETYAQHALKRASLSFATPGAGGETEVSESEGPPQARLEAGCEGAEEG